MINKEGYLYAKGNIPILLTAHINTVHKYPVKDFYEYKNKGKHILSSPQGIGGDDRCGVYIILQIIKKGYKPTILFCEDKEIGGIGSSKFCKSQFIKDLSDMKYLIELDRANLNDAVYYDCYNKNFIQYIEKITGYKETYGTFSDISNLAPCSNVAAVNLSCGYYDTHTLKEKVVVEEMLETLHKTELLLNDVNNIDSFEYMKESNKDLLLLKYSRYNNF